MMVGNLLLRGMIVGVIAGLLAFGFARMFGEPAVDHAIAFEDAARQAAGEAEEPEIVSRATQAGLGLFTGVVTYSAALGGILALVFAFAYGRLAPLGARALAALLALGGYIAVVIVPGLKYPPNPPAVGNPETIGYRTGFYFIMLVLSLAALAVAVSLARRLWQTRGGWNAALIGAATYVVLIIIVQIALPTVNEVPEQFPATLLWHFRVASFGLQAIIWTTLGLLFGYLAEQQLPAVSSARTRPTDRRFAAAR